jgi:Ulp1 family protease
MKSLLCVVLYLLTQNLFAQDYRSTVVTDPSISRRCDALMNKRNLKIDHKQKLKTLVIRNQKIQKIVPAEKRSIKQSLQKNLRHLEHELKLTLVQIQNQEENIIRKGCPGITL